MTLLAIQRDFRQWLVEGSNRSASLFPATARSGLDIYLNNYRAQLVGCLEECFPVTLAWLGPEAFHAAAMAHVEAVPPHCWTLDHYPRDFPATLKHLYPWDPEVGDLAVLELALAEAFVAADAHPLTLDLAAVDWDEARFIFVPSLSTHPLSTNAPFIWNAIASGGEPPPAVDLPQGAVLVAWRVGDECRFRSITMAEADCLEHLRSPGATFGTYCSASGASAEQIGQWLGQWLADDLVSDILQD